MPQREERCKKYYSLFEICKKTITMKTVTRTCAPEIVVIVSSVYTVSGA